MALSIPERIAQISEKVCADDSHGYSQYARAGDGTKVTYTLSDGSKVVMDGGDVDCSELAKDCVNAALTGGTSGPIAYMWTGNEDEELRALGFKRMSFSKSSVRRGDILLRSGHTGVALGSNKQAEAAISEQGTIYGKKGDQTGYEVRVTTLSTNWTYIYRYPTDTPSGTTEPEMSEVNATLTVTTSNLNVRDKPTTKGSKIVAHYSKGDKVDIDGIVLGDGYAWGTYIGGSGNRRYISLGTTEYVKVVA